MKATSLTIREIETKGFITEKEISLLKRRANAGDKEAANFWPCIECTEEQTGKAYKYLKNLYVTPNGKERKNNPFGYRETNIINSWNGEKAEFKGFYDAGRYGFHNYLPVYDFGGMEYYVCGGIQIIG